MQFDIEELLALFILPPSPPPDPPGSPPPLLPPGTASGRRRSIRQLESLSPSLPPPPARVTGKGENKALAVLKGAISNQIGISPEYIELELEGTVVSIDIFIGGIKGAPVGGGMNTSSPSSGVVLTLTASGSVSDYQDTTALKQSIATAAGVSVSDVTVAVAAASVVITATINVPASTSAATVQTALSNNFGTAADASAALGITVELDPTVATEASGVPGGGASLGGSGSLGGSLGGLQVEALEAATQKYAEDILVLVTQDKFMGELSETMAVPIYIISRPVLQEVIIFAPSPPPPVPPPPSPPPVPPYPPAPPHNPPPFICHPVYGVGDCSEHNFCGEQELEPRGTCDHGKCLCSPGFGGANCSYASRCRWWDHALGAWSSEGLATILVEGSEEDSFLRCSSDRLRSAEYAGVWELIDYAPVPSPPPPPPPPPPLRLPPYANPVLLALGVITATEMLALLVAVFRARGHARARASGAPVPCSQPAPEPLPPPTPPPIMSPVKQHGSKCPPHRGQSARLGSAPARPLCPPRARLAAPGSLVIPK